MKKRVAIIIGGKSVEHEVSIVTGLQVLDNIDKEKYDPKIIYVKKDGKWFVGESLTNIENYKSKSLNDIYEVVPIISNGKLVLYPHPHNKKKLFKKKHSEIAVDIVFPAVHGTNCEDGALHGYFQMNDIPCAFGSVLSSAIGMDKVIMKKLFLADGLQIPDFIWFYKKEYLTNKEEILNKAEEIGYPLIIKPANLGSSVGISKAKDKIELANAIEIAISYDKKVLIEKCIENAREINCAVLGYENYLTVSLCEEPIGWKEFLTYNDKYINGNKNNLEKRKIPADIDAETTDKIKKLAKQAFNSIDCSGTARIDFLYDGNNIYINEINTIPGSIGFYLWEQMDINFTDLINKIIEISEVYYNDKVSNIISYDVELLNNLSKYKK